MVKHLSIILSKHIYNVVVQRVIGISLSFKLMFTFYNYDISLTWIKLKYSFAVYISIISDIFPLDPISFISLEAVAQYSSIKSNQYTGRNRLRVKTTFNFNSPSCKGYYCFLVKIKWYHSSLLQNSSLTTSRKTDNFKIYQHPANQQNLLTAIIKEEAISRYYVGIPEEWWI